MLQFSRISFLPDFLQESRVDDPPLCTDNLDDAETVTAAELGDVKTIAAPLVSKDTSAFDPIHALLGDVALATAYGTRDPEPHRFAVNHPAEPISHAERALHLFPFFVRSWISASRHRALNQLMRLGPVRSSATA